MTTKVRKPTRHARQGVADVLLVCCQCISTEYYMTTNSTKVGSQHDMHDRVLLVCC
jgi:hypothetical protein